MRLERLSQLKKIHLIGARFRDLPACSIVPEPTALPRDPFSKYSLQYRQGHRLPDDCHRSFQSLQENAYLQQATTTSFHFLSKSSIAHHPTVRSSSLEIRTASSTLNQQKQWHNGRDLL
jgi:hypothetical protein